MDLILTAIEQALNRIHVNIIDLIDSRRTGREVRVFNSLAALRNYTMHRSGKRVPLYLAKEDEFLKVFLRPMV